MFSNRKTMTSTKNCLDKIQRLGECLREADSILSRVWKSIGHIGHDIFTLTVTGTVTTGHMRGCMSL